MTTDPPVDSALDPLDDPVGWLGCLDDLRATADRLRAQVATSDGTQHEADVAVKLFGAVMGAYLTHLWAEPEHPAFLPSVGYHQMYGTPNPDTIYRNAAIDGTGVYRITGRRGTVPDVTIMPFGPPVAGGLQTFDPFDLDDLTIAPDGTFTVVLSAQRPEGTDPDTGGDWWSLEPEMRTLMLRSVSERWGEDTEPVVAIVRLDVDPRRPRVGPEALRPRFQLYALIVEGMVMSGLGRIGRLRADGVVNRLVTVDYSGTGGGLADQWYQEGCFALRDDEVLLVETTLDPACRAFSLSLTDACFSTIDWANAQSSLNRAQAVVDADGRLRVVVGARDPGVHNWLDTTGHEFGALQFRWTGTPTAPDVSVSVVAVDALDDAFPAETARITPAQRADAIRARQVGAQLRAKW
jgi:hypothetical protein